MDVNAFLRELKRHIGAPYIYGGIGRSATKGEIDNLRSMYPSMYSDTYYNKALKFIGKQCFDCTGLIEYVLMGMTDKFDGAKYNPALDRTANGWIASCKATGSITATPPPIGALLFKQGASISHVGVYIGDGMNIQAQGIDSGCITEVWNKTKWTKWGLLKEVNYDMAVGEHWAKQFYDYLAKVGVINDDATSKVWQNFDGNLSDVNMGQFLALMYKIYTK